MEKLFSMGKSTDNWLVEVSFLDHSHTMGGASEPVTCRSWGVLYKKDSRGLYLSTWESDGEFSGENSDTYFLLKHPGIQVRKIIKV